jgi:16S rRNA (uracil1498-N3)-methyltransferase
VGERRFLVTPEDLSERRAVIRGDELHHLRRVLRLKPGDDVSVFDGMGHGFRGRIEAVTALEAGVALERPENTAEPRLRVTLLQGLPHGDRMDFIVEKAVEMGVHRIVPVTCERSVVRPAPGPWQRLERFRRITASAAKQSGRNLVPPVLEVIDFSAAAVFEGGAASKRARILFHPRESAEPGLARPLAGTDEAFLLVGPEGGWDDKEVAAARAAGWSVTGLGPRILRSDTAALVALTLVMQSAGELR